MYRDESLTEKPALLERRGGAFYSEAATQLVAALASDSGDAQVVDVRNGGTLAGLADDDVVEVPARVGRGRRRAAAAGAAGAGAARARAARGGVRAAGGRGGGERATARSRRRRCSRTRWWASGRSSKQLLGACSRRERSMSDRPRRRRRRLQDRPRARARRRLAARVRARAAQLASPDRRGRLPRAARAAHRRGARARGPRARRPAGRRRGPRDDGRGRPPARGGGAPGGGGRARLGHAHDGRATTPSPILRAGTERGWGVALVCGAGMNCVGVGPDGTHVRFPALGAITGDWGGGFDVGLAGLSAAARSEDGRGPKTALERPCRPTSGSTRRRGGRGDPPRRPRPPADRRARAARARRGRRTTRRAASPSGS